MLLSRVLKVSLKTDLFQPQSMDRDRLLEVYPRMRCQVCLQWLELNDDLIR